MSVILSLQRCNSMIYLPIAFASVLMILHSTKISAEKLVQVTDFGDNPSGIQMFEYVPANVDPNPALLVAIHWFNFIYP